MTCHNDDNQMNTLMIQANSFFRIFCLAISLSFLLIITLPIQAQDKQHPAIENFIMLGLSNDQEQLSRAFDEIGNQWQDSYTPMILEALTFVRSPNHYGQLLKFLKQQTGQDFGYDINDWYEWAWSLDYQPHPDYAEYKSSLYGLIDEAFAGYFSKQRQASIRLDEVRWGGVRQDGIPPLRQPKMIQASEASYLEDSNIVFGIEINGDVRAYPKRILAWHEMFVDEIGGESIAGVYCTLCGTVIIYDILVNEQRHEVGTSGFLYRSNKLMYDKATQSLWSTFGGEPVIGPLVGKQIKLPHRYVVTTSWGEWKKRHPQSLVLSLNTGHSRDYDEGIAYQQYFATDELMFNVPKLDTRLNNKSEVLGLIFNQHPDKPLAIDVNYLADNPIYHDQIETSQFVALTDKSGAIRVYENNGLKFENWDQDYQAIDENGLAWTLTESQLQSDKGDILSRLPANRAFWFGWFSAYPHTRLVK